MIAKRQMPSCANVYMAFSKFCHNCQNRIWQRKASDTAKCHNSLGYGMAWQLEKNIQGFLQTDARLTFGCWCDTTNNIHTQPTLPKLFHAPSGSL
jgi:hypothetical protein